MTSDSMAGRHRPPRPAVLRARRAPPRFLLYAASLLTGLVIWDLAARGVSDFILAPPTSVLAHLTGMMVSGVLPAMLGQSVGHMLLGFALAAAVAVPLGFLMGREPRVNAMVDPLVSAFMAIPAVGFVPFLIIWFGLFFEGRVALVFLMCVFDMLVVIAAGARDVDPRLSDVGRAFGAGRWQRFRMILLPASLPFLLTGVRIGLVRAVNGLITAELFFAAVNLGAYMKAAANRFDSAGVLSILVVLSLMGLVIQEGLRALEHRLLPWTVRH